MNSPLSSPGYLDFNSGRYNASMDFILNDIPLQGTVSPRDVFSHVELNDIDVDMDLGLLPSPSSIPELAFADKASNTALHNDIASTYPKVPLSLPVDQISSWRSQCPPSQASSIHLLPSDSAQRSPVFSQKHSLSASDVPYYAPAGPSTSPSHSLRTVRKNKYASDDDDDDDDEYSPIHRGSATGARKSFDNPKPVKKKPSKKTERPAGRIQSNRVTKFPKKYQCDYCIKLYTRPTDAARHQLTCDANPDRGQKELCYYCAVEAPSGYSLLTWNYVYSSGSSVRGDSAKRHWRSDACHYTAMARGITPYPRDTD
jgi:hypothetical protein